MTAQQHSSISCQHTKLVAGTLMVSAATKTANTMDTFATWLLAASAATLAMIISNLATLERYISPTEVKSAARLLIVAAALIAIGKLLAAILQGASEAASAAREAIQPLLERQIELDANLLFKETEKAIFPPARTLLKHSLAKFKEGDYTAFGRVLMKTAQIQCYLQIVAAVFVLWAMTTVATAINLTK